MHSGRFGRAQHRAKVMRIFDSIEEHKKGRFTPLRRPLENVLRAAIGFCRDECDDTLVPSIRDQAIKGRLRFDVDRNLLRLRKLDKIGKLPIGAKNEHPLKRASLRAKCLANGMQSIQQIRRTTASTVWCRLVCPR